MIDDEFRQKLALGGVINMRVDDKSVIILDMYDLLISGGSVKKNELIAKYEISIPTFFRYITLLRHFLRSRHGKDIVYNRKEKIYFIK